MAQENKKVRNNLTPKEIEHFRFLLIEKRKELLGNVSYMETDALHEDNSDLSNMPLHMADRGSDNYEQEFTLELMDSERKLLTEIYDALTRIEEGTYGLCENNAEPIPKPRLEAIPWARYCIACANLMEKKPKTNNRQVTKYTFPNDSDDDEDPDTGNIKKVS